MDHECKKKYCYVNCKLTVDCKVRLANGSDRQEK